MGALYKEDLVVENGGFCPQGAEGSSDSSKLVHRNQVIQYGITQSNFHFFAMLEH